MCWLVCNYYYTGREPRPPTPFLFESDVMSWPHRTAAAALCYVCFVFYSITVFFFFYPFPSVSVKHMSMMIIIIYSRARTRLLITAHKRNILATTTTGGGGQGVINVMVTTGRAICTTQLLKFNDGVMHGVPRETSCTMFRLYSDCCKNTARTVDVRRFGKSDNNLQC